MLVRTAQHYHHSEVKFTCCETVQGIRSPEALFPLDKLLRIEDLEISPSKHTYNKSILKIVHDLSPTHYVLIFTLKSKSLKGKFTLFLNCIYYRAYSMVGIIIHLMCVKSLQLACNYLLSVSTGGLAICSQ